MSNLIGDTSTFGIEYEITSTEVNTFGKCRIWIRDNYIGSFDDVNILGVTANMLRRLMRRPPRPDADSLAGLAAGELWKRCVDRDELHGQVMLSLGEGFDDFIKFSFASENSIYFIWKLRRGPFFSYPGYPKGVQFRSVDKVLFDDVVVKFVKLILERVQP